MEHDGEDFNLDEAREALYTLERSCERYASNLGKVVEELNSKQPDSEWLLQVLEEANKGVSFHNEQLTRFQAFQQRANAYIDAVRHEADQLAMQELAAGTSEGATPEVGLGSERKRSSKLVHPELVKFKLEKQAKILGKYGGVPALGAGIALPRLMKDSILKATGSPAAREIHFSKAEGKDATQLAEVMRFKVRQSSAGGGPGGETPAQSPWQEEMTGRKGKAAYDGTDAKDQVTPSTRSHAAYSSELEGVLRQRQTSVAASIAQAAASSSGSGAAEGPKIANTADDELARKLLRRQSLAKHEAEAAAQAEAEAAEAAATPATPSWSDAAVPFGGELASALQRRAEQQRQQSQAGAVTGPSSSRSSFERSLEAAGGSGGDVDGQTTPTAAAARRTSGAGLPPTPVAGLMAAVSAGRRPSGAGAPAVMILPPASSNELQEKLRRRQSALQEAEALSPSGSTTPTAPAAAP